MIGRLYVALFAPIAGSRLRPRLVFSVLLSPFDLIVAPLTGMYVWQRENFVRFLAAGIVLVCKSILVGRSSTLLFLGLVSEFVPRHGNSSAFQ